MKTNSQLKQQKLYELTREHDLKLSLADLVEFVYHEWDDNYLSVDQAVEHLLDSRKHQIEHLDPSGAFNAVLSLGRALSKAHKE